MILSPLTISVILTVLVGTILLATWRLARGPHILDRVIALDFMTVVLVGLLGVYAVATDQPSYLDVAMVIALLSFLGTVGFAYYVEQRRS